MIDDDFQPLPEEEERRIGALVRDLPPPAADPAFRAHARQRFLSGRSRAEPAKVLALPMPPRHRVQAFAWAAAAAVLVVTSVAVLNRGPAWQVTSVQGDGIAVVNQVPIPLGHTADLAAALRPGARLRVPEGTMVEISAPGALIIQLMNGADMILPATPARWFGRHVTAELARGELRIHTGEPFVGANLMVRTPEADVRVTGTTLAVICEPHGTCVCVFEGAVRVDDRHAEPADVPEGRRRFVFNDGRIPETDEIRPVEREMLRDLIEREPGR
jgi:ferric-dicitrate binding protein FerR (iron transport regulator)